MTPSPAALRGLKNFKSKLPRDLAFFPGTFCVDDVPEGNELTVATQSPQGPCLCIFCKCDWPTQPHHGAYDTCSWCHPTLGGKAQRAILRCIGRNQLQFHQNHESCPVRGKGVNCRPGPGKARGRFGAQRQRGEWAWPTRRFRGVAELDAVSTAFLWKHGGLVVASSRGGAGVQGLPPPRRPG